MRGAVKNYVFGQRRKIRKPTRYWRFEGSSKEEISGSSAAGTSVNNFFAPGLIGQSLYCQNQSGYRHINHIGALSLPWDENGDLPFSYSFWIKKEESNGNTGFQVGLPRNTFFSISGATSTTTAFSVSIESQTDVVIIRKLSGSGIRTLTSTIAIPRNEWVWLCYIDNGISAEKLYINNVEVGLTITDTGYVSMNDRNPYGIGINSHANANYSGISMIGGLDEFAFWRGYLLTEKEREHIWNNGNGRQIF